MVVTTTMAFSQTDPKASIDWIALALQVPLMLGYLATGLTAFIALFSIIPGEQPEKFLKSIVNLVSKFSRKPK